ncbi:carcinoembryonic antigen-related cell adhesion molecule 1-like [Gigantopelta aegis]|uniref:carcinoembryonic antigen-related cell adhesion molecule 1-like n=1 Tax=Gigantopelta aegis TaxID=1735272 RepID=UPI001B888140|nr:carcinoembryonic antigen-related cell adhesion molecule 1-like [Gigantopelta aegis]
MAQGYRYEFCFLLVLIDMIHSATGQFNLTASGPYGIVGSPFTFTCRNDYPPEVTWFVNDTEYTMHYHPGGRCHSRLSLPTNYTFNCSKRIFTLTINSVNISQHGTVWRCGFRRGPPESNTIVLEVRGGPGSVNIRNTFIKYRIYSHGRGECDIDILLHIRRNYTFNCSYELFTLTINSVNIHQHRTAWRCRGFPWESTSNTVVLEVRDGPGSTVRVNTPSVLIPEEGSDVAVSCAADCFLRCDFTWTFNNKTISNLSILSLSGINRTQNGTYTCTAVNPDIRQSANTSVYVDVLYQPVIKLLQLKKPDTKAVVDEVRPITLICVVDSNPTSSMKLFRDRQLVRQMTNVTSLEYTWREALCQTSGTYSCEAENSVKSPAKKTTELVVECFPGKEDGRFAAGFGAGIGTTVALLLLCAAAVLLYFRVKKSRKHKQEKTSSRNTEQQLYSNAAFGNQDESARPEAHAAPEADNTVYSSLGAAGSESPYEGLTFDNRTQEVTYENVQK